MKQTIILLILLCSNFNINAQANGLRVSVGMTTMTNQDIVANPEGKLHTGYHIGVDGRMMSGGMSFLIGGKFTSVSRGAIDDFKLSGHDAQLNLMNGRVGLDFSIISFGKWLRIRSKILGSFDVVLGTTGDDVLPQDYRLNDGWLGGVAGIGFDFGPATLDVEYEYGIINAYNKKKDSTFNTLSLSVGFFF